MSLGSAELSICIYCRGSNGDFHDIFDEVGFELQLPKLIRQFFGITVKNTNGAEQQLCDDCVNRLIELVDLEEHNKEQELERANLNNDDPSDECGQNVVEPLEETTSNHNDDDDDNEEGTQSHSMPNDGSFESHENIELTTDGITAPQIHSTVENENYAEDHDAIVQQQEEFYDAALIENHPRNDQEYQIVLDKQSTEAEDDYSNDDTVQYEENIDNIAEIIEQQIEDDELLELDYDDVDVDVEEEEEDIENGKEDASQEQYFGMEETEISESNYEVYEDQLKQRTIKENLMEEIEMGENSTMDNTSSYENIEDEEYLIEETICSEEYDTVDINDYLDNAIVTNFEELQFNWVIECKLCLYKHYTFQELIKHPCVNELIGEQQWCCIIDDCKDVVTNLKSLARHLIIKHYNNVQSLTVYGRCPDCQKSFSNLFDFNKHSCCIIKRRAGIRNFCETCSLDFMSMKRYVFHMQFHLTHHRPKICLLCGLKFNNGEDFFDHVSYFHEPETAMACIKCDRFFQDKDVFEQHMACHDMKYAFECTHCPKKYTNRSGLTSHMDIYHNHEMKPLQCDYCYKQFVSQTSYRSHIKAHMPESKVNAFICSACGLISNNEDIIQSHIETEECCSLDDTTSVIHKVISIGYACECCSIEFLSAQHLQQHRLSPKHDDRLFYCPICRKVFKTLKHMRNHLNYHNDYDDWLNIFPIARYYMCNVGDCIDAYPLWTSLYYHKKRHKNDDENTIDKLTCQFCQKLCSTKMSLAVHVARVHNNNNIQCQYCKKSYKDANELEKHIEQMHVSVSCSECNKIFKNRRNLLSHEQLVHEKKKRYFCSHCGKGYYYKSEMKSHEKNVHPNSVYKCDLCKFVTTYPKSLEIHHAAKHTDDTELSFKCSLCTKGFARKQLLDMHLKRHKEEKDFICYEYCDDGCNASFITFYLLKKHIQTKHPSTSKERDNTKRAQRHTQMYSMEEEMAIDVAANEDLISDNEYIIEEDENSDENQVNELEEGYEMDNDYNESQDA